MGTGLRAVFASAGKSMCFSAAHVTGKTIEFYFAPYGVKLCETFWQAEADVTRLPFFMEELT